MSTPSPYEVARLRDGIAAVLTRLGIEPPDRQRGFTLAATLLAEGIVVSPFTKRELSRELIDDIGGVLEDWFERTYGDTEDQETQGG